MKAHRPASRLQFTTGRFRRAPSSSSTMALVLLMLLGAVLGCDSSNAALDRILDAKTEDDASEQLKIHGPLRGGEVQYVYEATSSSSENRRRNAAGLLTTTLKGNADELRHKALLETAYDKAKEKCKEASKKYEEASKLKVKDKFKEYLAVKVKEYDKRAELVETAKGTPQALIDAKSRSSFVSMANANNERVDRLTKEADDLAAQADKLQKDNPDMFKK